MAVETLRLPAALLSRSGRSLQLGNRTIQLVLSFTDRPCANAAADLLSAPLFSDEQREKMKSKRLLSGRKGRRSK